MYSVLIYQKIIAKETPNKRGHYTALKEAGETTAINSPFRFRTVLMRLLGGCMETDAPLSITQRVVGGLESIPANTG